MTPDHYETDPVAFTDELIPLNEKGKSWRLSEYQRRGLRKAFRRGATGQLLFRLVLWSEVKKSGKTLLAACLLLWWAMTNADTEIIVAANDFEQSKSRVFQTAVALLKRNLGLRASVLTIQAAEIQFSNGTVVKAIAADYKGAAGSRHSLAVFDELWGYSLESAERLFEELTPPPTEENAWLLVVTTAGFVGESKLLESLYQRGLAGSRVDDELELYEADDLFMFWSHTPRQPWQTGEAGERYYAEQARLLRSSTFDRLHRNKWGSGASALITPELYDACVVPTWEPADDDRELPVWKGDDLAVSGDTSASVVVTVDPETGQIILVDHRIWRPSRAEPSDLEATHEAYARAIARRFRLVANYFDPYQAHRSLMTLQREGLPVRGFPQTEGNTARMGEMLYSLLRSRRLVLYQDDELRQQAMNAVGIEGARGVRIAKASASRKVDAIVALAMACCAASDVSLPRDLEIRVLGG